MTAFSELRRHVDGTLFPNKCRESLLGNFGTVYDDPSPDLVKGKEVEVENVQDKKTGFARLHKNICHFKRSGEQGSRGKHFPAFLPEHLYGKLKKNSRISVPVRTL